MAAPMTGLERVQHLYGLQVQLWDDLQSDLRSPAKRKEVRSRVREFGVHLRKVDPRYMGGEDVYMTLVSIQKQVQQRLQRSTGAKAVAKPKKVTKKKAAPKRKPAKKAKKMKKSAKKKRK